VQEPVLALETVLQQAKRVLAVVQQALQVARAKQMQAQAAQ
jgi:hypothetical protein